MENVKNYLQWTFKCGNWSVLLVLFVSGIFNVVLFLSFGFPILAVFTMFVILFLFGGNLLYDIENYQSMKHYEKIRNEKRG